MGVVPLFLRSSIGKKALMAGSGLVLVGFVIAHLAGNLLVYGGPSVLNAYAEKLRHVPALLWGARAFLLVAVAVHIWTSVQLASENRRARPQRYRLQRMAETTLAARTMLPSGFLVLAYLAYHLLHFTFRAVHPELSRATDALGRHDVYAMVVLSFQQPPIAFAYILGMAAVCFHLNHGIGSAAQTLGLTDGRTLLWWARAGRLLSFALFIGYISIPLAILLGLVG